MNPTQKQSARHASRLLEAALQELSDTQTKLGTKQLNSMLKSYFDVHEDPKTGKSLYTPKMIDIRLGANGSGQTAKALQVPLITLVPLNSLGVENVDIVSASYKDKAEVSATTEDLDHANDIQVQMQCKVSNYPPGLAQLLNVLTNMIEPRAISS